MPGTAPPDVANLLAKGDVEAALIWEPTTTQLTRSGAGSILATQQQLWEQASGAPGTEVHVVYVATPQVAQAVSRPCCGTSTRPRPRWPSCGSGATPGRSRG